jgi:hypothetical protein
LDVLSASKTPSGKPYVGKTSQGRPEARGKADGRDRRGAEVVDRYDAADEQAGRVAEQNVMNKNGGVKALDNRRNEIAPEKWPSAGVTPPGEQ